MRVVRVTYMKAKGGQDEYTGNFHEWVVLTKTVGSMVNTQVYGLIEDDLGAIHEEPVSAIRFIGLR